jgi:uncharacterized membrane protein YhiD involved in acid resistance
MIIGVFTGLGILITAVAGAIVTVVVAFANLRKEARRVREEGLAEAAAIKEEVRHDAETRDRKLEVIHTLVNSRLTQALDKIAALEKTIAAFIPQDRKAAQAAVDAANSADSQRQAESAAKVVEDAPPPTAERMSSPPPKPTPRPPLPFPPGATLT